MDGNDEAEAERRSRREVETLLDLMRDYLDVDSPADLGRGDLKELLLRIYPRKITVFDRG